MPDEDMSIKDEYSSRLYTDEDNLKRKYFRQKMKWWIAQKAAQLDITIEELED